MKVYEVLKLILFFILSAIMVTTGASIEYMKKYYPILKAKGVKKIKQWIESYEKREEDKFRNIQPV